MTFKELQELKALIIMMNVQNFSCQLLLALSNKKSKDKDPKFELAG